MMKAINFSITAADHWSPPGSERTIIRLSKLQELRAQSDIKSHVNEVKEGKNQTKMVRESMIYQILILSEMKY